MSQPLLKSDQGRDLALVIAENRSKGIDDSRRGDPDLDALLEVVRDQKKATLPQAKRTLRKVSKFL